MSKKISYTWARIWLTGIALIALFICLRITGHLLPGNNSSIYILKYIISKFVSADQLSNITPVLFDTLPVTLTRVYVLHILILPVVVVFIIYYHIISLKQFGAGLEPVKMRPTTILILFSTVIIVLSIFIKPTVNQFSAYGESWSANVPWEIQFLIWIKGLMSFSVAVISIIAALILFMSLGYIVRRIKS